MSLPLKLFKQISDDPPQEWSMEDYVKLFEHKEVKLEELVGLISKISKIL